MSRFPYHLNVNWDTSSVVWSQSLSSNHWEKADLILWLHHPPVPAAAPQRSLTSHDNLRIELPCLSWHWRFQSACPPGTLFPNYELTWKKKEVAEKKQKTLCPFLPRSWLHNRGNSKVCLWNKMKMSINRLELTFDFWFKTVYIQKTNE